MLGLVGSMAWFEPSPPGAFSNFWAGILSRPWLRSTGRAEAAVVLHRAVDLERRPHIVGDVEELADGDSVLPVAPVPALVVGHGDALVEALDQVVRVLRVDPQGVVVAARAPDVFEGLAAVGRDAERHAQDVDGVLIVGVDADLAENPAVGVGVALHERLLFGGQPAHLLPGSARVVGPEDRGPLDDAARRDAVGIRLLIRRRLSGDFVIVDERVEDVAASSGRRRARSGR